MVDCICVKRNQYVGANHVYMRLYNSCSNSCSACFAVYVVEEVIVALWGSGDSDCCLLKSKVKSGSPRLDGAITLAVRRFLVVCC